MARGKRGVRLQEALGLLVIAGIENSIDISRVLHERGGLNSESAGSDLDALVVAVEKVEGVSRELKAVAFCHVDFAHESQVGRGVVGPGESVAAVAGKPVVVIVAVLVGIAVDRGIDGASTAGRNDAGNFPVVEQMAKKFVLAVKGPRFHRKGGYEAVALIGNAGSALTIWVVGILHRGGLTGDQRILAVVDRVGVRVREPQIGTAGHPAVDGES